MQHPLLILSMDADTDRVVARMRDGRRRYLEIELRRDRMGEDPRARVERFLASLVTPP